MLTQCATGSQSSLEAGTQCQRDQSRQVATESQRAGQGYPMQHLQIDILEDDACACVCFVFSLSFFSFALKTLADCANLPLLSSASPNTRRTSTARRSRSASQPLRRRNELSLSYRHDTPVRCGRWGEFCRRGVSVFCCAFASWVEKVMKK